MAVPLLDLKPQFESIRAEVMAAVERVAASQLFILGTEVAELEREKLWGSPIVTQIVPLTDFYPAEEYHRDYFERNPGQGYCQAVVAPKVAKFRKKYFEKLSA